VLKKDVCCIVCEEKLDGDMAKCKHTIPRIYAASRLPASAHVCKNVFGPSDHCFALKSKQRALTFLMTERLLPVSVNLLNLRLADCNHVSIDRPCVGGGGL
jgi:hypothetical protein